MTKRIARTASRTCWVFALALGAPSMAGAQSLDAAAQELLTLESDATRVAQGIQAPTQDGGPSREKARQRKIDGQAAFSNGSYANAAILLYEYVENFPDDSEYDEALYYLAESLFQNSELHSSREYFTRLARDVGARSKFYPQALQRLVELAIKLESPQGADAWIDALDRIPATTSGDAVPYVLGKYLLYAGRHDEALVAFNKIAPASENYLQSRYLVGTAYIGKDQGEGRAAGHLAQAVKTFNDLITSSGLTDRDKKIVEMAHLALGRLYYECNTPEECGVDPAAVPATTAGGDVLLALSLQSYHQVPYSSEYAPEALLETSWAYVKNKQYEQALHALEFMAIIDPESGKPASVRLLEGNLRIRMAQGRSRAGLGDSTDDYERARVVFETTHKEYAKPYEELSQLLAEHQNIQTFFAQRSEKDDAFDLTVKLPAMARAHLDESDGVQRVRGVHSDLTMIKKEIAEARLTLDRLKHAVSAGSGMSAFPELAGKHGAVLELLARVTTLRRDLARRERDLVDKYAQGTEREELARLRAAQKKLELELDAMPQSKLSHAEAVEAKRAQYDRLERTLGEVGLAIDAMDSTVAGMETYLEAQATTAQGRDVAASHEPTLVAMNREIEALLEELTSLQQHVILGRDSAAGGGADAEHAASLRAGLREALDAEHTFMATIVARMTGGDRQTAQQIESLTTTSREIADKLKRTRNDIVAIVDAALKDVRAAVAKESVELSAYEKEYTTYSEETRVVSGEVLGEALAAVRKDLYDVLVRTDMGAIDITWAQKEFANETAARLGFDEAREMTTLRAEFQDIIDADKRARAAKTPAEKTGAGQ